MGMTEGEMGMTEGGGPAPRFHEYKFLGGNFDAKYLFAAESLANSARMAAYRSHSTKNSAINLKLDR